MLKIHNLHTAMGTVKMRYVSRDRINDLAKIIITSWSHMGKVGVGGEHTAVAEGTVMTSAKTPAVTPGKTKDARQGGVEGSIRISETGGLEGAADAIALALPARRLDALTTPAAPQGGGGWGGAGSSGAGEKAGGKDGSNGGTAIREIATVDLAGVDRAGGDVENETGDINSCSKDGWLEDHIASSDWSEDDDSNVSKDAVPTGEKTPGEKQVESVRVNLCTILRGAVQPKANGLSMSVSGAAVLTLGEMKKTLLLTSVDIEQEEKCSSKALQKGDPGSDNQKSNFWFKCSRHTCLKVNRPILCLSTDSREKRAKADVTLTASESSEWINERGLAVKETNQGEMPAPVKKYKDLLTEYKRQKDLKSMLKKMDDISTGKSDMVLACGIGVIRKRIDDETIINCPLLEVDLSFNIRKDDFELRPECQCLSGDFNSKIRLCPSLSVLEESDDLEKHTLQKLAQKKLDQFIESKNKGVINPFDPTTYKSLLTQIGRVLDKKCTTLSAKTPNPVRFLLSDPKRNDGKEDLQIFDTWIIFQRQKPDASKIISKDAQRFLDKLLDPNQTVEIPPLWTHICTDAVGTPSSKSTDFQSEPDDFLLPMKQNKDQLDILKRLESNDCIVVQGPPGTGKSHTIGNTNFLNSEKYFCRE